jgi:hypothetical protein
MSMISNADFNARFAEFLQPDSRGVSERHDLTEDEDREFSEGIYRILNAECTPEERTEVHKRIGALVEAGARTIRREGRDPRVNGGWLVHRLSP